MTFLNGSLEIDPANIRLVIADTNNCYLGQIAFFDFSPDGCQLDIVLADPLQYDRGIGTEAVKLALETAFAELSQKSVRALIKNSNLRAIRCAQKTGFHLLEKKDLFQVWVIDDLRFL